MDFLKDFNWKTVPVFKMIGALILAAVAVSIVIWLVGFGVRMAFRGGTAGGISPSYAPIAGYSEDSDSLNKMSARNIGIKPSSGTVGADAESFEVTRFTARYETGNLKRLCAEIEVLKPLPYVIFETSNMADRSCNYVFKVENAHKDEIRNKIEALDPRTFVENIDTIKNVIEDYTSQEQILKKKLESIEKTLTDAQYSYDELKALATRAQDAETLAKVIESKISLIERLTTERLNTSSLLETITRQKAQNLDRLNYTYFEVFAYENPIVDLRNLKDAWVAELQQFVREFNKMVQDLTVNLVGLLLKLVSVAIYVILALFIAKYSWRFGKTLWKM